MFIVAHEVAVLDRESILPERQVANRNLLLLLLLFLLALSSLTRVRDERRRNLVRAESVSCGEYRFRRPKQTAKENQRTSAPEER